MNSALTTRTHLLEVFSPMMLFAIHCAQRSPVPTPPVHPHEQPPAAISVTVVAQVFAMQPADLLRTTRGRAGVALARQIAMYLAHVVGGQTLTDIGTHFQRDRTTVAHACRLVEARRDDPSFDRIVELLEWILPVFACRRVTGGRR